MDPTHGATPAGSVAPHVRCAGALQGRLPHMRDIRVGSPYPIDNGASTRTLWRRVSYGGKKGRAATRRLHALERRIAPYVLAGLATSASYARAMLEPALRFAGLR